MAPSINDSAQITMKPKISIIYSLARSGATLISRCLGCDKNNVILSEINPRFSWFNPLVQASQWYGLFTEQELVQLRSVESLGYADAIMLISEKCRKNGLDLIIRDWTHIDFTPGDYPVPAIYRRSQDSALRDRFEIKEIAIIRHPLDTYLSVRKVPRIKGILTTNDYMAGFLKFAEVAKRIGFVKYEDFCEQPQIFLRRICDTLGVGYADGFESRYTSFTRVTGDIYSKTDTETVTGDRIGLRNSPEIRLPPRREAPIDVQMELSACPDYKHILDLFDYNG